MNRPLVRYNNTLGPITLESSNLSAFVSTPAFFDKYCVNPMFIKDRHLRFISANQALCNLLNKEIKDILEKTISEIIGEQEGAAYHQTDLDLLETKQVQEFEWSVVGPENTRKTYLFRKIPLLDQTGNFQGIFATMSDITSLRQDAISNQQAQAELIFGEKLSAIATITTGLAHEINNPLTIARGFLDILKKRLLAVTIPGLSSEGMKEIIKKMDDALIRIKTTVDGLKHYSQSDKSPPKIVDVHQIINQTLSLATAIFEKEAPQIQIKLNANSPKIYAHDGKFQQILLNILRNSVDAIIEHCPKGQGIIIIETINRGGDLLINISDNGGGMPPEIVENLFTPFFTTKTKGKGTGLGLSLAQNVLKDLGGDIKIENRPREGVTVCLEIPTSETVMGQLTE